VNEAVLADVSRSQTRITLTNRCTSRKQRDAMAAYGAGQGAQAVWERLADLRRA
jgi:hypothetical protein